MRTCSTEIRSSIANDNVDVRYPCEHVVGESGRRTFVGSVAAVAVGAFFSSSVDAASAFETLDVEDFMKTGMVANPTTQQAGKSKPETGVVLREGTEVARDSRSGAVVAEILLDGSSSSSDPNTVLTSFESPWPLAKGTVFDVECRDARSGDGVFLAVSPPVPGSESISDVPADFFMNELFKSTGRFSFYGSPTDVKVKKSYSSEDGAYRFLELAFSNLSQSTNAEIPRRAIVAATVPVGSNSAVMLTGSATAARWKKGSETDVRKVMASFQAVPAPKSSLKARAQQRR